MIKPTTDTTSARAYQPPSLVVLGSVEKITLGGHGSFPDLSGLSKKLKNGAG